MMLRYRPRLHGWDLCPLRRGHGDLGVYLDRETRGLKNLIGWRIIMPRLYLIVLLRPGRHRAPVIRSTMEAITHDVLHGRLPRRPFRRQ